MKADLKTEQPHNLFHGVVRAEKESVVLFSTKLSFTASCYDLTSKAKKAVLCIMQKLRMLNNNSFELFLKLFDSQVQPIALYGAKLWGLETAAAHCEIVHLFALKKFLGLRCERQMTLSMVKQIGIRYL